MRSLVPACVATAVLMTAQLPAQAQEADLPPPVVAAQPAPARAADPGLPSRPIPYTKLAPRPAAKARPAAPRAQAQAPTSAPTASATSPITSAAPPLAPGVRVMAGARLQAGQVMPAGELEAFVDGFVRQAMSRQHVAGVTVSVVQNGQVLLKKGYGFASLAPHRPVDPDTTLFRIGSISKTFTWIALMKEVEAGRIRLDQPVNLYLPERVQVRDQGYDRPVRVIDLMAHTAGFEDRALGHLFERDPDYVRPLELYLRRERPRRVREPGQSASYSNYGAALAGEAVAYVSGRPFERRMEEDIFLPLGMRRTTFRELRPAKAALPAPMPSPLTADVAEGYGWTRAGFVRRPYEYAGQVAPAGSASSTAGDMAKYMLAILGGGQYGGATIYGPRAAQAFRTPILATPPGINGWAHGFMVEPLPGGRLGYGHAGATLSFTSRMVTAPDLGLGVFVAANTDTGLGLARDLPQAIVRQFYAPAAGFPRPGSTDLIRQADRFEGAYLSTRRAYGGLEGFVGRLTAGATVRVTPEGRLLTVDASGPQLWVPEGDPARGRFVAMQGEERLVFRMTGDGQGASFVTSQGGAQFERTSFWRSPGGLGMLAGLAAGASILTLGGALRRSRREMRENAVQNRASLIQNLQAGLWLASMASFGAWGAKVLADPSRLVFGWPGALLVTASACALVASALTIATIFALPAVWRGGRRVDSWPILRRAAFTLTVAVYLALAILLTRSGALGPWNA